MSLLLALLGWGAMSLAIGRLVASLVFAALLIRWSPVPYRFGWDRVVAARLLRFGLPLAAASIVVFASGYADQMIVGGVLGAQALGFYVLAFNLASWPVSIFSQPLRAVAPATFSSMKSDPARMSRTFYRILALLACVAVPACLAISGAATPVIEFVYGGVWLPAAGPLLWLAAFAALKILFELAYDYLVVQGKSGVVLIIQSVSFVVSLPLMMWAAGSIGEGGVAACQFVVALLVMVPLYVISLRRVGVAGRKVLAAVVVPAVGGGLAWAAARGLAAAIDSAFLAAATAAVAAVLIIAALAARRRDDLRLLRSAASRGAA